MVSLLILLQETATRKRKKVQRQLFLTIAHSEAPEEFPIFQASQAEDAECTWRSSENWGVLHST